MNKQRLEQIIQILIMPYTEREFLEKKYDIIKNYRNAFWVLKYQSNRLNRKEAEINYYRYEKEVSMFFQKHSEYRVKNLDDIKLLLEMFYPEDELARRIQFYLEHTHGDGLNPIDVQYLANIYEIAKSLLTFRDGKIAIRTWFNPEGDIFDYPSVFNKIEIWSQLGRLMTTDIIVVAFFVLCNLREEYNLFNQSGNIMLADKTLEQVFRKGLAETHMHFNAGVDFQYLWQHRMNPKSWLNESSRNHFFYNSRDDLCGLTVMIYRNTWAEYLESGFKGTFVDFIHDYYVEDSDLVCCLLSKFYEGRVAVSNKDIENNWKDYSFLVDTFFLHHEFYEPLCDSEDFLLKTVFKAYQQFHTSSELILLFKSLWHFNVAQNEMELRLFLQYIRCKNLFFGSIVRLKMVEGLANFRNAYSNMIGRFQSIDPVEERYNVIFKSISQNVYLKKLEIRITPPVKFQEYGMKFFGNKSVHDALRREYLLSIRHVLNAFRDSMLESGGLDVGPHNVYEYEKKLDNLYYENRLTIPTMGIVFHFLKRNYVDNKTGVTCWLDEVDYEMPAYKNTIAMRQAMITSAKILEELRSSIPLLSEYVVGMDVASEENAVEPWIYAPVFKAIRQKKITKPLVRSEDNIMRRNNNIGFTYHVGEEFRHILSGLRHVDEVINEYQYKAGDRLGHALSLGVDIDYWMSQNEAVVMPVQEYLEDLLWLWGKRVYSSWDLSVDMAVLEGQIIGYVKMVLGDVNGLTLPVIYDAYKLKFESNYIEIFEKVREMVDDTPENCATDGSAVEHFCKFYSKNAPYGLMWTPQKLFCTFFCPVYYCLYNKPILVRIEKSMAEVFKTVQKEVILEVEQKGVYIETNPTSNLAIGELNSMVDLSILNLNARGLVNERDVVNEVLATVNSDNPVIFNTNCENEHAYVYHALTYKGFPKERVLQWIDKVRQMGLDSSFVKNIKKPSVLLTEIDALLVILERELRLRK